MRSLVAWFFVLLIPSAHFHCVMDHGQQLRIDFQHQVHATIPFESQAKNCENESACICKGATLASPVRWDIDLDHHSIDSKLKLAHGIYGRWRDADARPPDLSWPDREANALVVSQRSGRQRRILFETFLL